MYVGVQNCSKSYGLYVGRELEIFLIPTACDYSLTDVEIFTSPTAIYRRGTWNLSESQSLYNYRGESSDFDMFHVLRPGYTIPQNHTSNPHPQILGTWKIFEKFCDPGTLDQNQNF